VDESTAATRDRIPEGRKQGTPRSSGWDALGRGGKGSFEDYALACELVEVGHVHIVSAIGSEVGALWSSERMKRMFGGREVCAEACPEPRKGAAARVERASRLFMD